MTQRTDLHRVSKFKPESYEYLFSFSLPSQDAPGYNVDLLRAAQTGEPQRAIVFGLGFRPTGDHEMVTSPWGQLRFFNRANTSCDCCGAHFLHGSVYLHTESGEAVTLGHICCEKAGIYSNDEWQDAYKAQVAQMRESRRAISLKRAGLRRWVIENRSVAKLLHTDHDIARDMRFRLIETGAKWGFTEKQIQLLQKLADDAANPKAEEVKVAAPKTDERIRVEGTVLSVKEHESAYGYKMVMTVKVETADGIWITWGTIPGSIIEEVKRGSRVAFDAKIVVSDRDESFTFFKRPTKAQVTNEEAASAAS